MCCCSRVDSGADSSQIQRVLCKTRADSSAALMRSAELPWPHLMPTGAGVSSWKLQGRRCWVGLSVPGWGVHVAGVWVALAHWCLGRCSNAALGRSLRQHVLLCTDLSTRASSSLKSHSSVKSLASVTAFIRKVILLIVK